MLEIGTPTLSFHAVEHRVPVQPRMHGLERVALYRTHNTLRRSIGLSDAGVPSANSPLVFPNAFELFNLGCVQAKRHNSSSNLSSYAVIRL
jgi:hypothetical protein